MAAQIGFTERAVRNKCWRLGLRKKEPAWTDEDFKKLQELYKVKDLTAAQIAELMGRSEAAVAVKGSRIGLAFTKVKSPGKGRRRKFQSAEELSKYKSDQAKKWILENGHPRGALGMKHSKEAKEKISKSSKAFWSDPSNKDKIDNMIYKSMVTKVANGKHVQNRSKTTWKAGWREIGGKRKYFRSKWEANYARYLEWLKQKNEIEDWLHEPVTFWFAGIKRGCVSYLPDFWVKEKSGSESYHEVKGWMDDRSKTKIKRMGIYHPKVKLIVINGDVYGQIKKSLSGLIPEWEE